MCVCVGGRDKGCLLGFVFRLWTFGVTTNFNFPSKSYVNFCSGRRNQSSIRLGLSSGRTWTWLWTWAWTWTWLGDTAANRTLAMATSSRKSFKQIRCEITNYAERAQSGRCANCWQIEGSAN